MNSLRPTWAEIDLGAVAHNIGQIRQCVDQSVRIMAVVKANAYGHGLIEVAKLCAREGVDYLGVALLDEAAQLRDEGIDIPILVLGYTPPQGYELLLEHEIRQTIFDVASAAQLSEAAVRAGKKAFIHIKIDTGMTRIGFPCSREHLESIERICRMPGLEAEGIFTHFASADTEDRSYTLLQLQRFTECLEYLQGKGLIFPIRHAANSAGILMYPEAHFDMVRAGITLYGLSPSPETNLEKIKLIPAMRLKSRVIMVKEVPAGTAVSYGCTYVTKGRTRIATVPIGYGDGYTRLFSDRAWASIHGKTVPLIGRVCMDQVMFDVTQVDDVKIGDEIILFGRPEDGITADDLAEIIGTINYEVVCLLNARVPRKYVGQTPAVYVL